MPVRQIFLQLKNLFLTISRGKKIALACIVIATVIGFALLITWSGKIDFKALYTHLDQEDAGIILTRLKEQKIPYRIDANGTTIMVPDDKVHEIRLQLASEGLPQGSGIGFEVFDNAKLGMTEFAQNVNYQRALQGELSRTINRISEIESSRVHIVMSEKSLFIDDEQPASASVVLKLRSGKWLSQEQVNGIVHLVSSSVPRLSPDNITVVDSNGKMLAGDKTETALGTLSDDQLEYQHRVERLLENRVKTMLESALGENKAIVRLSCAFDFKRQEKTEELYLPENKVVRSEQLLDESSLKTDNIPKGIPGVRSNLAGAKNDAPAFDVSPFFKKQDRTVNYEIGKVTNHILEPVGEMTRVSVAVLVDGTYKRIQQGENESWAWQYVPRTAEELQKLESIVKRAVNFDPDRGDQVEVANLPFETGRLKEDANPPEDAGWLSNLQSYKKYLKHVFLGLFLILTFLFVVRPLIRWLTEHTVGEGEIFKQLPKTVGEIEDEYNQGIRRLPFRDQASQLIANDSEASLGVMNNWLNEK